MAAGWLGWPPEVILSTPIGQLELALEGKVDFIKKTSPWGSSEDDEQQRQLAEQRPDPDAAARRLMAFVQGRQARDARDRKRKR